MLLRASLALVLCSLATVTRSAEVPWLQGGHVKLQNLSSHYPDNSLLRDSLGAVAHDQGGDLRLKFSADFSRWKLNADYQFNARFGDSLKAQDVGGLQLTPTTNTGDDRRWWDLTQEISNSTSRALSQRLDRLNISYTGNKTVLRFGRQAISWGNGLIYNPVDVFNPFDPTAVDTEYKSGDDMLYAQYLLDNGSDWQLVQVQRRDAAGEVSSKVASSALKFHGFTLDREFDLLLAQHFDQWLLGAGGVMNLGQAVLRGDLTFTDTERHWVTSTVTSLSYSWVWWDRNISGTAEYYFNGFGLREGDYGRLTNGRISGAISGATDPGAGELAERLGRGELYSIGRHYIAGSLQVEFTPLLHITPTVFVNLGDSSALLQISANWDLSQDWQLLAAVNLPLGASGSEYGGLTLPQSRTLESGVAVFAQLAFYF